MDLNSRMDLNSMMNLGGEGTNFVDYWMPITPQKTIAATSDSTRMWMNGHGDQFLGRENWQESGCLTNAGGNGSQVLGRENWQEPFACSNTGADGSQFLGRENWQESGGFPSPDGHGSQFLGRENWQELGGFPNPSCNRTVQQVSEIGQLGMSGKNRMINEIAGSYTQALQNESAGWDGKYLNLLMGNDTTSNASVSIAERPINLNLCSWGPSSAEFSLANQTHCSNSNMSCSSTVLEGIPQYGFPVPYHAQYDLNSTPSIENYGASTVTNSFQFAPLTPNEKLAIERREKQQQQQQQHDIFISMDNVHNCHVLPENNADSSSAIISVPSEEPKDTGVSTSIEEPKDPGVVSCDQLFDLNKTPQQKTPKRRKHRPKVIKEGKSKRTPEAPNMKTPDPEKKASEKRKYVRKVQQELATSHLDSVEEIIPSSKEMPKEQRVYMGKDLKEPARENADNNVETSYATTRTAAGPSCKKALNFDSENFTSTREKSLLQQKLPDKETETSRLRTSFQVTEPTDTITRTESSLHISQQNKLRSERSEAISNLARSMKFMQDNNASISGRISASNRTGGNLNVSARDMNTRNQQLIHAQRISQIGIPNAHNGINGDRTGLMGFQFNPQSVTQVSPNLDESRRSKRQYSQDAQISHGTNNHLRQEIYHRDDYRLNSNEVCSETRKRMRIENGIKTNINDILPSLAARDHSRARPSSNNINSVASASQRNSEILYSYLKMNGVRRENESNVFPAHPYTHSVASVQDKSKQNMVGSHSRLERAEENCRSIMFQTLASMNTFLACNMLPPIPRTSSQPGEAMQPAGGNNKVSLERAIVPVQCRTAPSRESKMQQSKMVVFNNGQSPPKRKGPVKQKFPVTVEDITYQLESLNLGGTKGNAKNALVPYKGDRTLIPYEGFEFIKKRKPRPKVDLDAETERVWKLLMWKEGSEDQGTDEEKKKWWDEERRVFRGRADSFIARMHLVQGDRRFSKWKGSVVDSVIGVFLTQNVSDHLSSSAFMSLAARFPLKPTVDRTCQRDGTIVLVEEPDLCLPNLNGKLQEKLLHHPFYHHSSVTPHRLEEQQLDSETSCTERAGRPRGYSLSPEEVLSSQDSFDSTVTQINGVRSYSGSNSEAEEPVYKCNNNYDTGSADLQGTTSFAEFYSHINGGSLFPEESRHEWRQPEDVEYRQKQIRSEMPENIHRVSSTYNQQTNYINPLMHIPQAPSSNYQFSTSHSGVIEVESLDSHREESISSWPSRTSTSSRQKDASSTSENIVQGAENVARTMATQYGSARNQENPPVVSYGFLNKQLICEQGNAHPRHRSQPHNMVNPESRSTSEPVNLADVQTERQLVSNIPNRTGKFLNGEARVNLVGNQQNPVDNKVSKSNSNDRVTNKINLNVSSTEERKEKGKANSNKKDAIDWDSLRKQVIADGKMKEKSKDAMDSLDYEAIRRANVNQIADTIRERGMNNMLAERMKEFLDRLVRDHGSIDLEWLRDVPPDKAKEYLLSIRGLGLKSVECVRLLTLHHDAFPVDTNVGRIAVRLGWVPLQPLPESLQLHLLELYPILESIQKYLWPRLCKLDQRTLYELHYQMITFGKVFCTKSKPNCNACPMRAECRHFASAFASARLALPGPEEKSIVAHSVPLTSARVPGIIVDHLPLPSPEDNKLQRVGTEIVSCVPIVEEPATPEQEPIVIIESDIEDLCNDDPDEIPTIKLNMEELSVNLQSYMQTNMDIQEIDVSKALVALNPEAASIPTPKLKNISRLRTEHNVYELPDSHPLLNGMDKREPDDPSPYLLAIWTPGETAESILPPGRHCQSQETGKLCNEKTCFSCNSIREANSQIVRGTILIPCRTAMRGSFPLNGTYFQVNEMFADHASSVNPIDVPRAWIWNLSRRMVYFGTSVSTIFKGLSTEQIQYCFWRGFVCVRGFDQKYRAPRPLQARLHFPASKLAKTKNVP
ncbi:HhH-GPD base excision DNA repair family protein [Euphorbia peplus]|nr:HhH-GPD base excision DNA repair family protein [Euphorbia peplus]